MKSVKMLLWFVLMVLVFTSAILAQENASATSFFGDLLGKILEFIRYIFSFIGNIISALAKWFGALF